uniref:hypothetical protein n=1 Tax=Candidatus Enterococcus willemsii TaxID=1857215 RepID=UPI00403F9A1B
MALDMQFDRLILTKEVEFYQFSYRERPYEIVAYLLLQDAFKPASKEFGWQFYDYDFEPNDNQIFVKIGTLHELSDVEREYLLSFTDGLLRFKPSINYVVDFFKMDFDIECDYPKDEGFLEFVDKINSIFKTTIALTNVQSINNLVQE